MVIKTTKVLSLKHFIYKAEVLKLYRKTLRLAKTLEPSQRQSVRDFARHDIESVKHIEDLDRVRQLITEGKRKVQDFELSIAMTR